jgi:hypothetical protein
MNGLLLLEKEINKCETKMGAHVARLIPDVRTGAELSRESLSGTVGALARRQNYRHSRLVKN